MVVAMGTDDLDQVQVGDDGGGRALLPSLAVLSLNILLCLTIFKSRVILSIHSILRLRHKLLVLMSQTWWSALHSPPHSKYIV